MCFLLDAFFVVVVICKMSQKSYFDDLNIDLAANPTMLDYYNPLL